MRGENSSLWTTFPNVFEHESFVNPFPSVLVHWSYPMQVKTCLSQGLHLWVWIIWEETNFKSYSSGAKSQVLGRVGCLRGQYPSHWVRAGVGGEEREVKTHTSSHIHKSECPTTQEMRKDAWRRWCVRSCCARPPVVPSPLAAGPRVQMSGPRVPETTAWAPAVHGPQQLWLFHHWLQLRNRGA